MLTAEEYQKFRGWIDEYDRKSGPRWLVSPDGWRDALRTALDHINYIEEKLWKYEMNDAGLD